MLKPCSAGGVGGGGLPGAGGRSVRHRGRGAGGGQRHRVAQSIPVPPFAVPVLGAELGRPRDRGNRGRFPGAVVALRVSGVCLPPSPLRGFHGPFIGVWQQGRGDPSR